MTGLWTECDALRHRHAPTRFRMWNRWAYKILRSCGFTVLVRNEAVTKRWPDAVLGRRASVRRKCRKEPVISRAFLSAASVARRGPERSQLDAGAHGPSNPGQ